MTWQLHNVRPIDRAPQARKHVGPYYGERLRRVLAPEVTDPSLIERVTDYYFSHRWPAASMVAFGAIVAAAVVTAWIVTL